MSRKQVTADLQRWSDEVARDPRSLAFLPLARAYRRQGLREAALQLCLRGLEIYPTHVEGHGLLALLYLEAGQREKAADEWSMVLRMEPDNFEALRGIGFCYLERDQLSRARQALERAALLRPTDPAVQEALSMLGSRQDQGRGGADQGLGAALDDPWAELAPAPAGVAGASPTHQAPEATPPDPGGRGGSSPAQLFAGLLGTGPLLGVLLLDVQGLVLAGSLTAASPGTAEALAAVLGGAVEEAERTVLHLSLGQWRGIMLETAGAVLHVAPVDDLVVLLAARKQAPAGWVLRCSTQAVEIARRYLHEQVPS